MRSASRLALGIEAQHQVVLVVAQVDVEARLMLLDQRVLEQQRLFLVRGDDRLDVGHDPVEQRHEVAVVARRRLEVLPHAVAQHAGLADVDRLAAAVLHDVDARRRRQPLEDLRDGLPRRRDRVVAQVHGGLNRSLRILLGHRP
jgi:hypothetical protein